ncbi:MAG TPA: polysaccharide biosynthesis tyrosine autokinase [Solirubrobacteraceae bacterium]|nr:polysaccharide biosynthesis tyrosine autokinase [Solirubrobacteraceae bacterium]
MSAADRFERARESEGLASALAVLRRRWLIVASVVVACVLVLVVSHERKAKSYSATASVSFQSATLPDAALQIFPSSSTEPQREANTEVYIAHSPEVAEAARAQLHSKASASELLEAVKVEAAANADVLNVVATANDSQYAAQLANAFAEQYIAFRARADLEGISTAETKLKQQIAALPSGSSERATLQQSLQRLGELQAVAGGGANLIGRATAPANPTGMSLSTTVIVGIALGLAIAFALVFLLETLDRRIKTIEEFERAYRLPALASVPQSSFRTGRAGERTELLEPYRILRSALEFAAVTRPVDTLLVTSAVTGEGKTTVSVDLAHATALTGRRTVLVELDLRRPTFSTHFGLDGGTGVTTALTGGAGAVDLLRTPLADVPNLFVLPAGPIPHNPSELLGSQRIEELIAELAAGGGMVILDAPPLNPVADTQVLLNNQAIHAAIVVARIGGVSRDAVRRARGTLDRHIVEPLGIVVTGLRDSGGYGYGSYSSANTSSGGAETGARQPGETRSARLRV